MIIIGYPGVGKTSLAGRYNQYIDLESSHFNDSFGEKRPGWFITYCRIAEDLSQQGYRVFVSCHNGVQEYFSKSEEYVMIVYPSLKLKDVWVKKIRERFEREPSLKNAKALQTVDEYYDTHIKSLMNSPFENKLVLGDMNYTLDTEIDNFILKEYM